MRGTRKKKKKGEEESKQVKRGGVNEREKERKRKIEMININKNIRHTTEENTRWNKEEGGEEEDSEARGDASRCDKCDIRCAKSASPLLLRAEAQKEAEEATTPLLNLLSRRNYSTDIIDSRQIKNLFRLEIVGAPERKIY